METSACREHNRTDRRGHVENALRARHAHMSGCLFFFSISLAMGQVQSQDGPSPVTYPHPTSTLAQYQSAVYPFDTSISPKELDVATKSSSDVACMYTQWSEWSRECQSHISCGDGFQIRTRYPTANDDTCTDVIEDIECEVGCVHVTATKGVLVIPMLENAALVKEEEDGGSALAVEDMRYTYGSLYQCSSGCHNIDGLDTDHDIVCVMCPRLQACETLGELQLKKSAMLDIVRNKRDKGYAFKVDGERCSCLFTPKFPLVAGMCSSPSFYINLTAL